MSNITKLGKYAVRVTGLGTNTFDVIHVTSLVCISLSFVCALIVVMSSLILKDRKKFFKSWTKCERFAVYLAICDILFSVSHFSDHLHMYLTRYHVTPIELCEFYGFFVFEFITAQYCMVFLIATNALCLIKYRMRFYLGKRDWKFLVISFGGPFVICVIAAGLDQMGPVGSFCGISGRIVNLFFSVVPQLFVLVACSILYAVTWYHISKETKTIQASLGQATQSVQSSRLAARNMSLFVAVFFIQYAPSGISSIVMMRGDINPIAVPVVLAFTNIGGVLNCIVYLVVRKKGSKVNPTQNSSNNKEATGKHSSKTDMDTSDNKPMAVI